MWKSHVMGQVKLDLLFLQLSGNAFLAVENKS